MHADETHSVESESEYRSAIQEGLADVEAGRYRSLEEVTAEWVERGLLAPDWHEQSTDGAV